MVVYESIWKQKTSISRPVCWNGAFSGGVLIFPALARQRQVISATFCLFPALFDLPPASFLSRKCSTETQVFPVPDEKSVWPDCLNPAVDNGIQGNHGGISRTMGEREGAS
jgi:hypothetical protein